MGNTRDITFFCASAMQASKRFTLALDVRRQQQKKVPILLQADFFFRLSDSPLVFPEGSQLKITQLRGEVIGKEEYEIAFLCCDLVEETIVAYGGMQQPLKIPLIAVISMTDSLERQDCVEKLPSPCRLSVTEAQNAHIYLLDTSGQNIAPMYHAFLTLTFEIFKP